jgi:hypothetical protein
MTAEDIILAVRQRLGDEKEQRWTTQQLLLYTTLCQNDICLHTSFYRRKAAIALVEGQLEYDLPTDCIAVTRLEYEGKFLPIESRNEIDKGSVTFCAVKDNLEFNKLELYIGDSKSLYDSLNDIYGILADSDECVGDVGSEYGVVVAISPLMVYYIAVPPKLETTDQTLVIPDYYFAAFVHYVTGTALQDDNDAGNVERGELELAKYNRLLSNIYKKAGKDFTTNVHTKLDTVYRRI